MENLKLIHQLFIGKVADEIGMERTTELLKKAKEAFYIHDVVPSYNCLGCGEYYELNDLIRFQVIGESAVQNSCGKCLTKIIESGKMVEIL